MNAPGDPRRRDVHRHPGDDRTDPSGLRHSHRPVRLLQSGLHFRMRGLCPERRSGRRGRQRHGEDDCTKRRAAGSDPAGLLIRRKDQEGPFEPRQDLSAALPHLPERSGNSFGGRHDLSTRACPSFSLFSFMSPTTTRLRCMKKPDSHFLRCCFFVEG